MLYRMASRSLVLRVPTPSKSTAPLRIGTGSARTKTTVFTHRDSTNRFRLPLLIRSPPLSPPLPSFLLHMAINLSISASSWRQDREGSMEERCKRLLSSVPLLVFIKGKSPRSAGTSLPSSRYSLAHFLPFDTCSDLCFPPPSVSSHPCIAASVHRRSDYLFASVWFFTHGTPSPEWGIQPTSFILLLRHPAK